MADPTLPEASGSAGIPITDWSQFKPDNPAVSTSSGGSAGIPITDWSQFKPDNPNNVPEPEGSGYIHAGLKLVPRTLVQMGTTLADVAAEAHAGIGHLGYLTNKATGGLIGRSDDPAAPTNVTGEALQGLANRGFDIRMDKDAGMMMRVADAAAPFIAQELATEGLGGIATAVKSAPTWAPALWGGVKAGGKLLGRAGADTAGSYLLGNIGNQIGGPIGGVIGGITGAMGRGIATTGIIGALKSQADPEAAAIAAAGPPEGVTVTPEMVTGGQNWARIAGSLPFGLGNYITGSGKSEAELEQAVNRTARQVSGDAALPVGEQTSEQIGKPLQDAATQHLTAQEAAVTAEQNRIDKAATDAGATIDTAQPIADMQRRQAQVGVDEATVFQKHIDDLIKHADAHNPTNADIPRLQAEANRIAAEIDAYNRAEQIRLTALASNDPIVVHHADGTPMTLRPGAPSYDSVKQDLYGTPTPPPAITQVPVVPPRGTRALYKPVKTVQSNMFDKANQGTLNTPNVANAREVLKGHIQRELNAQVPGLGNNFRAAQQRYARHVGTRVGDTKATLEPITGTQDKGIFEANRPDAAQVGGRVKAALGLTQPGGATHFAPELAQALSNRAGPWGAIPHEKPIAQAYGRAYANVGRTGTGNVTRSKSSNFSPEGAATDLFRMPPGEKALMERNTTTAPGRSITQQIENQRLLAKALGRGETQAGSSLTRATTVGNIIPQAIATLLHHKLAAVPAGLLFRSVLRDPKTVERIAGQRGLGDIIAAMARSGLVGGATNLMRGGR